MPSPPSCIWLPMSPSLKANEAVSAPRISSMERPPKLSSILREMISVCTGALRSRCSVPVPVTTTSGSASVRRLSGCWAWARGNAIANATTIAVRYLLTLLMLTAPVPGGMLSFLCGRGRSSGSPPWHGVFPLISSDFRVPCPFTMWITAAGTAQVFHLIPLRIGLLAGHFATKSAAKVAICFRTAKLFAQIICFFIYRHVLLYTD